VRKILEFVNFLVRNTCWDRFRTGSCPSWIKIW